MRDKNNHKTGNVRGLLCPVCNLDLGKIERDDGWLDKAKAYIVNYEK